MFFVARGLQISDKRNSIVCLFRSPDIQSIAVCCQLFDSCICDPWCIHLSSVTDFNHPWLPCVFHSLNGASQQFIGLCIPPWPQSASELYWPSDRRLSAKLMTTFAGRGCCVVSATNLRGRYFRFPRPEPLLFHSSSSSVVLKRLSGPRSKPPSLPRKSGRAGNRTRNLWICSQKLWPLDHRGGLGLCIPIWIGTFEIFRPIFVSIFSSSGFWHRVVFLYSFYF
jgi:hypothetical protein